MTTIEATVRIPTRPIFVAPSSPFYVGQRVRVTAGGHRDERGTVRDVRPAWDGQEVVVVTLDTAMLFYGSARCLEPVTQ